MIVMDTPAVGGLPSWARKVARGAAAVAQMTGYAPPGTAAVVTQVTRKRNRRKAQKRPDTPEARARRAAVARRAAQRQQSRAALRAYRRGKAAAALRQIPPPRASGLSTTAKVVIGVAVAAGIAIAVSRRR